MPIQYFSASRKSIISVPATMLKKPRLFSHEEHRLEEMETSYFKCVCLKSWSKQMILFSPDDWLGGTCQHQPDWQIRRSIGREVKKLHKVMFALVGKKGSRIGAKLSENAPNKLRFEPRIVT